MLQMEFDGILIEILPLTCMALSFVGISILVCESNENDAEEGALNMLHAAI